MYRKGRWDSSGLGAGGGGHTGAAVAIAAFVEERWRFAWRKNGLE